MDRIATSTRWKVAIGSCWSGGHWPGLWDLRGRSEPLPCRTPSRSASHDGNWFLPRRRTKVREEIREGLAQYTGTVTTASSPQDAVSSAIGQLADYAQRESLVRNFAYASGSAYGILLDAWSPGWTRQVKGPE